MQKIKDICNNFLENEIINDINLFLLGENLGKEIFSLPIQQQCWGWEIIANWLPREDESEKESINYRDIILSGASHHFSNNIEIRKLQQLGSNAIHNRENTDILMINLLNKLDKNRPIMLNAIKYLVEKSNKDNIIVH